MSVLSKLKVQLGIGTWPNGYKGIDARCRHHLFAARCLCNRCVECIEEETGYTMGSITYAGAPNSGLLACNDCLATKSDWELAEHYTIISTHYWNEPVSVEDVLATLQRNPSNSLVTKYQEGNEYITEILDLDTGSVTKTRAIDKSS